MGGEPGDERRVTYAELTDEVKRLANVLECLGIGQGDRVAIYLPMIREAVAAMLAVARIGAIHSAVFGGFSADSLRARIEDAGAKLVITADGGYRKGKVSPLKPAVDPALGDRGTGAKETVEHVLVVKRGEDEVDWTAGRHLWWHDVVPAASAEHEAQAFPSRTRCSSCTPRAPPKPEGDPAHLGRPPHPVRVHQQNGARHPPRDRRVPVDRRHRLGHRGAK